MNLLMLPGLETAAVPVRTAAFTQIADQLEFAATFRSTLLVTGDHGTGKRFAVLTCLTEQAIPYHHIVVPPNPTSKDIIRLLYEAVTTDDDVFALRDMQDELVAVLAQEPRIILIDGAEQLTAQAAEQLHYLHRQPGATWTLVLLGATDAMRALKTSANLHGEVIAWVEVEPLRDDALFTAVGSLHPMFLAADAGLIHLIDTQICKGLIKNWARFLQAALYLHRLDAEAGREPEEFDLPFIKKVAARLPLLPTPKKR